MPYFRVRLSGSGIRYQVDDGDVVAIGFFTTRQVRAENENAARALAEGLVLSEWDSGSPYAKGNTGPAPEWVVEDVCRVSILTGFLEGGLRGYTFYQHDD